MTLWATDDEIIERWGVPEKVAREAIRVLDHEHRKSGFPQKQALFGNRRYWPAVQDFLDLRYRPRHRRTDDAA